MYVKWTLVIVFIITNIRILLHHHRQRAISVKWCQRTSDHFMRNSWNISSSFFCFVVVAAVAGIVVALCLMFALRFKANIKIVNKQPSIRAFHDKSLCFLGCGKCCIITSSRCECNKFLFFFLFLVSTIHNYTYLSGIYFASIELWSCSFVFSFGILVCDSLIEWYGSTHSQCHSPSCLFQNFVKSNAFTTWFIIM